MFPKLPVVASVLITLAAAISNGTPASPGHDPGFPVVLRQRRASQQHRRIPRHRRRPELLPPSPSLGTTAETPPSSATLPRRSGVRISPRTSQGKPLIRLVGGLIAINCIPITL
ncbi:hypothetical protein B0H14DRAFT_3688933 [Mycena olivaceomarginata]|nr:hypothetical protein B0H14DRAFT_3688933 [Mycena olivaceomarginata]